MKKELAKTERFKFEERMKAKAEAKAEFDS
jgi:hypothetical protein